MAPIDVFALQPTGNQTPFSPLDTTTSSGSHTSAEGLNNLDEIPAEQFAIEAGGSNELLSISQQKSIRQLISQVQLDSQISHVLNTLGAKRDQAAARLQIHRVAIAPHKNLPSEVLGNLNIFVQHLVQNPLNVGLPPKGPDFRHETLSLISKSWAILHICKRWRQIALEEPRVWSSVQVYYGTWYERAEEKSAIACEILSRSGNVPIVLALSLDQKYPDLACTTNPVTSVVLPCVRQIQRLHVTGFPREWLYPFFDLPSGQLESLEAVELNMMVGYDDTEETPDMDHMLSLPPFTAFESAPRLRAVALRADQTLHLAPAEFLCPWNQLTSIEFRST